MLELLHRPEFGKYFKNTSWLFIEQILRLITGVFVGAWVARYLGPERLGVFSYCLAFVGIFGILAKLGLDAILVKELVHNPEEREDYLGTAFWLKLVAALLILVLVGVGSIFGTSSSIERVFILIIASGLILQSFEVVELNFQALVQSKLTAICKIIQLVVSSLAKIILILIGADLVWFVVLTLLDQIVLAIGLLTAQKRALSLEFLGRFRAQLANKLLRESWPLLLAGFSVMLYMRIDQIMVKSMLGEVEVGIYSAAVTLTEAWYFVPMVLTSSLFPAVLSAKKYSEELYYRRLQQLMTFLVWIAIGVAVLVSVFAADIVSMLYGPAFSESASVLLIQIWGGVFVAMGVASGQWLVAEGLQRLALIRTLLGATLNVILNILLIPAVGVCGAAIGMVLSQLIAAFGFDFTLRALDKSLALKVNALLLTR